MVSKTRQCPRCGETEMEKVADSPVPGVWEVFGCNKCNYLWRSTETGVGVRLPQRVFGEAIWLYKDRKPELVRTRNAV